MDSYFINASHVSFAVYAPGGKYLKAWTRTVWLQLWVVRFVCCSSQFDFDVCGGSSIKPPARPACVRVLLLPYQVDLPGLSDEATSSLNAVYLGEMCEVHWGSVKRQHIDIQETAQVNDRQRVSTLNDSTHVSDSAVFANRWNNFIRFLLLRSWVPPPRHSTFKQQDWISTFSTISLKSKGNCTCLQETWLLAELMENQPKQTNSIACSSDSGNYKHLASTVLGFKSVWSDYAKLDGGKDARREVVICGRPSCSSEV